MKQFSIEIFSERLKMLRAENNLSQNALAQKLDLSNASISYWETGKQVPSAEVIYKMSLFFDISADFLLGITNDWQ